MLFEELIDRCQECIADRLLFAGWIEQVQQCRQYGDARGKGDKHADAGDRAEFRNALVVGRQEGKESRRCRHRGQ